MKRKNLGAYVLIASLIIGNSVNLNGQPKFGIRGGINLANVALTGLELDPDTKIEVNPIAAFHLGGIVEFDVVDNIALQSGLLFMGKGSKIVDTYEFLGEKDVYFYKYTPLYLQVPINVLYDSESFFFGAGPYFALGISGKETDELSIKEDISFGSTEEDDWTPLDYGFGAQGGIKINGIRVGFNFDLGLSNNYPSGWETDEKSRNRIFSIFATYIFSN